MKKLASSRADLNIKQIVHDLKTGPMEGTDGKEWCAQLLSIVVEQQYEREDMPATLVKAGAVAPLVALVAAGSDGAHFFCAATLASIAFNRPEHGMRRVRGGGWWGAPRLLRRAAWKAG